MYVSITKLEIESNADDYRDINNQVLRLYDENNRVEVNDDINELDKIEDIEIPIVTEKDALSAIKSLRL